MPVKIVYYFYHSSRMSDVRPPTSCCYLLDANATAILANIDEAATTPEDVAVVSSIAHLAPKASLRRPIDNALETSGMLTLGIVLQLSEDIIEALHPQLREQIRWRISVHDLFCPLFGTVIGLVHRQLCTVLLLVAANLAEAISTLVSGTIAVGPSGISW
jgi:hypothetical protein